MEGPGQDNAICVAGFAFLLFFHRLVPGSFIYSTHTYCVPVICEALLYVSARTKSKRLWSWYLVGKWKTVLVSQVVSDSLWPHRLQPARLLCPWNSPGRNTGVGSHPVFQRIFLISGLNLGLIPGYCRNLHCRQIHYCLSYQGSPVGKRDHE